MKIYASIKLIDSNGEVESKNYRGNGSYPFTLSLEPKNKTSSEANVIFYDSVYPSGKYNGTMHKGEAQVEFMILSPGEFDLILSGLPDQQSISKFLYVTECSDGFFLDRKICSKCFDGCKKCNDSQVCQECFNKFADPNDFCKCSDAENMYQHNCQCKMGFEKLNGKNCSLCKRWIQKDDISINLIENYNVIEININKSLTINKIESDIKNIILNQEILGTDYSIRVDGNTYRIELGDENKIFSNYLSLNISNFYAKENICGFIRVLKPLDIPIFTGKVKPRPQAIITQNLNSQNICDDTKVLSFDAKSSRGNFRNNLQYKYQVYDITNGEKKPIELQNENSNNSMISFEINKKQKISSILIKLTVETYFKSSDSSEMSIDLDFSQKLYPVVGSFYRCWYSMDCQITIDQLVFCENFDSITYKWEILHNGYKSLSRNSPLLIVEAGELNPGNYDFVLKIFSSNKEVSVSKGKIEMISDSPQIYIDRVQGAISRNSDLTLIAKQKSLDSNTRNLKESTFNSKLSYDWDCIDPNQQELIWKKCDDINEDPEILVIPREYLKSKSISIRLTITSSYSSYLYYNATLYDQEVPPVKFSTISKGNINKFPKNSPTIIDTFVDNNEILKCDSIYITKPFQKLDIKDCQFELNPSDLGLGIGLEYQLILIINGFEFFHSFKINTPPLHGSFSIEPSNGKEFETDFMFIAMNWLDDDEDLPLRYSFSYGQTDHPSLLRISQAERYSTKLAWVKNSFAICRIYDSLDDFTEVTSDVQVKKQENLSGIILQSLEKIEPSTSIPAVISNVISATLKAGKYKTIHQEIFRKSIKYMNDFILISNPTNGLIDQIVENMNSLILKTQIIDSYKENVDLGLSVTTNLLDKVEKIGVDSKQAQNILNLLQCLIPITDDTIVKSEQTLLEFIKTNNKINILIMRRLNYVSDIIISSQNKKTISNLSVMKSKNLQNLISFNQGYSFNIRNIYLENQNDDDLIGVFHTLIKSTPSANSHHQLFSLSLYENSIEYKEYPLKTKEINVIIEIPANFSSKDAKNGKCLYFEENLKRWSTKGCEIYKVSKDSIYCACNHLTTFTIGSIKVPSSYSEGIREFTLATFSLPGFIFSVVILFAFAISLLRAFIINQLSSNNKPEIFQSIENTSSLNKESQIIEQNEKVDSKNLNSIELKRSLKSKKLLIHDNSHLGENSDRSNYPLNIQSDPEIINDDENLDFSDFRAQRNYLCEESLEGNLQENESVNLKVYEEINLQGNEGAKHKYQNIPNIDYPLPKSDSQKTNAEKIKEKLQKIFMFYKNYYRTIQIIIFNKQSSRKYYKITKIYFIIFFEALLDALYFYLKREENIEKFEETLEENFHRISIIAIFFTALLTSFMKCILFIIEKVKFKRHIKYRFIVLPFVFILLYIYFIYEISCFSTAFGKKVSILWLVCCLISITAEILIFEPFEIILGGIIKRKFQKTRLFNRCIRLKIFWRSFRCEKCKNCEDCKSGLECPICQLCDVCHK